MDGDDGEKVIGFCMKKTKHQSTPSNQDVGIQGMDCQGSNLNGIKFTHSFSC